MALSGAFQPAVYASNGSCANGTGPTLYGYIIDPASGSLTAIGSSPFSFPSPTGNCTYDEGVSVEASGNFVYAVEANSGVASYKVNQSTGALTLASSAFAGPAALTLTAVPNPIPLRPH